MKIQWMLSLGLISVQALLAQSQGVSNTAGASVQFERAKSGKAKDSKVSVQIRPNINVVLSSFSPAMECEDHHGKEYDEPVKCNPVAFAWDAQTTLSSGAKLFVRFIQTTVSEVERLDVSVSGSKDAPGHTYSFEEIILK